MAKFMNVVRLTSSFVTLSAITCLESLLLDWVQTPQMSAQTVESIGAQTAPSQPSDQPGPQPDQTQQWRRMNQQEQAMALEYILNSPIGIAALNQLAIERFVSPVCRKTFYVDDRTGGFQTLLRVKCPDQRGASISMGYDEVRVIFNRFEDSIESFEVKRVYPGRPVTPLPE